MNRELALQYARNLGANFPFLRPAGEESERFADCVAAALLGADGDVPPERVEEGVGLVGMRERRRLVESYARTFPDVWDSLCDDIGREEAERELLGSAVRAAVNERREPARHLLEALEDPRVPDLPHHPLSCAIFHDDVWSLDDAVTAAAAAAGLESFAEAWVAEIAAVARTRLEPVHLIRIRTQFARLCRHLPLEGLPRASALLARGCDVVARSDDVAKDVAVSLLRNYVVHLVGPPGSTQRN